MKTPQLPAEALRQALGLTSELWLKREDLHHFGSHKGRSIPLMIKTYLKNGSTDFVISSSGNAALAAIIAIQEHNLNNPARPLTLTVFVGQHISEEKYRRLQAVTTDSRVTLQKVEQPKQAAFQEGKNGAVFLRQSTDDLALEGYLGLGEELGKIQPLSAIFIPTSSGTTAQALAQYFLATKQTPQIHIIQTTACHPIAEFFDTTETDTKESIAGAIVDRIAYRKEALVELIKKTKGAGWIVTDEEIMTAMQLGKNHANIPISATSALAIAGLAKALKNGWSWDGAVACLLTGE